MGSADWSGLPEDLLLIAMEAMEVADVVRSGAVCSAWRSGAAGGAAACTVLLVHMPHGELSFASPGDERWTPLPQLRWIYPGFPTVVQDDEKSGLFYVLRSAGDLQALDLSGPSPVTWHVATTMGNHVPKHTPYLIPTPCGRSLLLVTRSLFRSVEFPEDGEEKSLDGCDKRRCNAITTGISIETIGLDGRRLERPKGVVDSAMFLGRNSPICLPVAHYPMLKRNCAYLVDDCQQTSLPIARRDHGIWDFESGSLHKPTAVWPHRHPWSDTSIPIWITPSLY